jgi:hypothetical protein
MSDPPEAGGKPLATTRHREIEEGSQAASAQVYEVESASPPLLLFILGSELRTAGVLAGLVDACS